MVGEEGEPLNPYLQDLLNAPEPRDTVLLEHLRGALPHQQGQQTEAIKPHKKEVSDNKWVEARLQRKLPTTLFLSLDYNKPSPPGHGGF